MDTVADAYRKVVFERVAQIASMNYGELKQLIRALRRAKNRIDWRRLGAARTSQVGTALRLVEQAMGPTFVRRTKQNGVWSLHGARPDGTDVSVAEVRLNAVHHVPDFKDTAVEIVVLDKSLLDVDGLALALQRHAERHHHRAKPVEDRP